MGVLKKILIAPFVLLIKEADIFDDDDGLVDSDDDFDPVSIDTGDDDFV